MTKSKHYFLEQMKELVEEEEALLAFKEVCRKTMFYRGERRIL